jgi:hypothetical protein
LQAFLIPRQDVRVRNDLKKQAVDKMITEAKNNRGGCRAITKNRGTDIWVTVMDLLIYLMI